MVVRMVFPAIVYSLVQLLLILLCVIGVCRCFGYYLHEGMFCSLGCNRKSLFGLIEYIILECFFVSWYIWGRLMIKLAIPKWAIALLVISAIFGTVLALQMFGQINISYVIQPPSQSASLKRAFAFGLVENLGLNAVILVFKL